ncbi:hypothetical protein Tco_0826079 [Tanacetum coccineum]
MGSLKTSGSKKGVLMSKRAVTIHGFSESLLRGQTRGILATSADEVIRRSNNVGEKQISFGKSVQVFDQGPLRILGLWVKGHQFQVALLFTKLKLHQAT